MSKFQPEIDTFDTTLSHKDFSRIECKSGMLIVKTAVRRAMEGGEIKSSETSRAATGRAAAPRT